MTEPAPITGRDQAALQLTDVSKSYPGVKALDTVSLTVLPGEVHGLIGENGAGKSTLVNVLTGGVAPDAGTIEVRGDRVQGLDPLTAMQLGISVSHQEIRLASNLSVAENILFGSLPTRLGSVRRSEARVLASAALDTVGVQIDPRATVGDLSVAHQQMVEIARAVRLATCVLVLDEPTAALSQHEADALFEAVARIRDRGVAVIYVSHRLEEILSLCDRITVLRDGRKVADRACADTTRSKLVRLMVGREMADMYPDRRARPGEVLVRADGLHGPASPHPTSLEIRTGEIVGVFGLVGAGRSEFVRLIAGVDPVSGGRIEIGGRLARHASPADAVRHGIAFVPEDRKDEGLVLDFTIAENLALPNLRAVAREHSLGRGGLAGFARDQIRAVDIRPDNPHRAVATLSGGNQQKTAIAKWLSRRPRLLIIDEPTRGVDVGAKAQIYALLADLAANGMAILMVSSELPEVLGLSDRIVVFHDGRITGELLSAEATPEAVMHLALGDLEEAA